MAKPGQGARPLTVKLRTAKGRKASSARWLVRQLNDPYVARAKREGYRSRSAFKLIEIDDRYRFLRAGGRVVDLGAAPGGWSQVAAARVVSTVKTPRIVAVDALTMDPIQGVVFLQRDFLDDETPAAIQAAIGGRADVVLSDLAAPTIGHRQTDHLRTKHLYEAAADFAADILDPGGHFLAKVFRGGAEAGLLAELKRRFEHVAHVKPKASRPESVELYLLARGFRG